MTMTCQKRVHLRPVDLGDADKVQRWYAEPQVVEYAILQPFLGYSLSEVQDLLKKWLGRDDRKLYVKPWSKIAMNTRGPIQPSAQCLARSTAFFQPL